MRRTCKHEASPGFPIAWYREFSRRFLLKRIRYRLNPNDVFANGIAGHLQEWDPDAQRWDTVVPALYELEDFGVQANIQVFPF